MLKTFILLMILSILMVDCENNRSVDVRSMTCDTLFYSFNKNKLTEEYVDSVLSKHFVSDCRFKFSNYFDTLFVSFSISDTIGDVGMPSNRFLLLKERRLKVLADEDYFISLKKLARPFTRDPNYIKLALSVPDLNVLSVSKYPF